VVVVVEIVEAEVEVGGRRQVRVSVRAVRAVRAGGGQCTQAQNDHGILL